MVLFECKKYFSSNLDVAIVSVVLVVLLFTLIAVGYFCYKKKNKTETTGLGLGAGGVRVSGGGTKKDRNTFVPNFVGKPK